MRNLLVILVVLISTGAFAQTSLEEYKYIRKGIKIQLENGMDIKEGYSLKDVGDWGIDYQSFRREVNFYYVMRKGDKVPCATLMIFQRTDTKYKEYMCIPHYDSSQAVWNQAQLDFRASTKSLDDRSKAYMWGMMRMISYMSTNSKLKF